MLVFIKNLEKYCEISENTKFNFLALPVKSIKGMKKKSKSLYDFKLWLMCGIRKLQIIKESVKIHWFLKQTRNETKIRSV